MFQRVVLPILQRIVRQDESIGYRSYRIVGMGESYVEEAVGADLLRIPGLELGYCARMGEVDLRVIGSAELWSRRRTQSCSLRLTELHFLDRGGEPGNA